MGRKTWESIPDKFRPLPGRVNVVLSKKGGVCLPDGVIMCRSLEEALDRMTPSIEDVFVIGGGQIFIEAINHPSCHKLFITHIQGDYACDAFFPPVSQQFLPVFASEKHIESGVLFQFCEYLK